MYYVKLFIILLGLSYYYVSSTSTAGTNDWSQWFRSCRGSPGCILWVSAPIISAAVHYICSAWRPQPPFWHLDKLAGLQHAGH